ncbi:transcription initiation factor IIB [Candidatus Bathyarchaeota archaeon]|nr:transcription initiation factor IIB [Candidatus Bathyarchaeota archaeon]
MVENVKEINIKAREERELCTECQEGYFVVDEVRGEKICSNCGLVVKSKIVDLGPEWRAFDSDQKKKRTRVGAPITYTIHDKGLSTMIDFRDRDSFGRKITPKMKAKVYRYRKWQRRIRVSDAMERNLTFALTELDRMASALTLPKNLKERSSKIYRAAVRKHLIRGRSIEGVAAASIYAGCRLCKIPRTLSEIADVARVDKREIHRCYRFISQKLSLNAVPTSPLEYISRFASGLKLSGDCQKTARKILRAADQRGLTSGRGPTGVAAAALYLASVLQNERRTQRDIAKIAKVTEVTVRNRFKELMYKLNIKIPEE